MKTSTRKQKRSPALILNFTKSSIEKLSLPKKGQSFVWDSDLKGFGVRLTSGGRTYVVQRWVKSKTGVEVNRRKVIGRHGVLTLQEARKKAQKELSAMLDGKDPSAEKKRTKAYSLTLREITDEYLKDRRDMKKSSKADIEKHLSKSFAAWANKPAIDITRDKVATRFSELTDRSQAQANQAFRVLRSILNYARAKYRTDDKPLLVENPVSILSETKVWNKVKPRSGRIPTDKIGAAWNMLQALREAPEQTTISRSLADAVSFLILTGARWNEAAQLTWNRVSLEEKWWYLPDPKNRNPVKFPLSELACEILEARRGENQTEGYVFPARSGDGYIIDPRGTMEKVSQVAGVHLMAHDMRRTFRAIAGECKIELWKTKLLMNHKLSQDVTISAYTETEDLRYLAPEINLIGEWIAHQGMIAASEKVLPFKAVNERGEA
ncbi:MAG: integrase [Syntrophus sp. (in: bacteria)]|nr:integrase [Syntrophus sp. (in: bacteria)]